MFVNKFFKEKNVSQNIYYWRMKYNFRLCLKPKDKLQITKRNISKSMLTIVGSSMVLGWCTACSPVWLWSIEKGFHIITYMPQALLFQTVVQVSKPIINEADLVMETTTHYVIDILNTAVHRPYNTSAFFSIITHLPLKIMSVVLNYIFCEVYNVTEIFPQMLELLFKIIRSLCKVSHSTLYGLKVVSFIALVLQLGQFYVAVHGRKWSRRTLPKWK